MTVTSFWTQIRRKKLKFTGTALIFAVKVKLYIFVCIFLCKIIAETARALYTWSCETLRLFRSDSFSCFRVRVVFAWKAKTMMWNRMFVPFSIKRNLLRMETLLSESVRVDGTRPLTNDKVDAPDITKESWKSFICCDVGVSNLKCQNATCEHCYQWCEAEARYIRTSACRPWRQRPPRSLCWGSLISPILTFCPFLALSSSVGIQRTKLYFICFQILTPLGYLPIEKRLSRTRAKEAHLSRFL